MIPEDRADVKVEMLTTNAALPLEVRTEGGADGHRRRPGHRINDCHTRGDHPARLGPRRRRDPLREHAPDGDPHAQGGRSSQPDGAVYGAVGRAASLDLDNSGCSAWTVADVAGDATLRESGAGSVRMGSAGRLELRLSGAGSVHATQVRQGLDADLSGAGSVNIDDLSGPMDGPRLRRRARQGRRRAMPAPCTPRSPAWARVEFGGDAQSLDASISGFGGIRVKAVSGQVTKSVSGGGHVTVG